MNNGYYFELHQTRIKELKKKEQKKPKKKGYHEMKLPYHVSNPLTCPFHIKAFEVECQARAERAEYVIHEEMGKGHSNLPESIFSVLTHFRSKSTSLQKLAYEVSTNLGLLCANEGFVRSIKEEYSWQEDLLHRCNIPITPAIQRFLRNQLKQKTQTLSGTERRRRRSRGSRGKIREERRVRKGNCL